MGSSTTKEEQKRLKQQQNRLGQLPPNARDEIKHQLDYLQASINNLCNRNPTQSLAYTLGSYLSQEREKWEQRQASDFAGFPWDAATDILFLSRDYQLPKGRTYMRHAPRIFDSLSKCASAHPHEDIPGIADKITFCAFNRRLKRLKEVVEGGDIVNLMSFLGRIENDETKLKHDICRRKAELNQRGIILKSCKQVRAANIENIPKMDFSGELNGIPLAIEVKDLDCDYKAIGQVLSYLAAYSSGITSAIRGAIMARTYIESAIYAAFGQNILLYRIDPDETPLVVDCVDAKTANWEDLQAFLTRSKQYL